MVFGFCDNKCKHEIYTKEETYSKEEVNAYREGTKLSSTDDVNRIYEPGTYLCTYGNLPANLPVNKTGVLEVIKSGNVLDHCIQRYHVEEYNEVYIRHISEELNNWVKVVTTGDYAVLTGTITMPEANNDTLTGSVEVSYPYGFTQSNCIVIGLMSHNTTKPGQWATTMSAQDALSMLFGNGDLTAILKTDVIRIMSNKPATTTGRKDVTYKLVLMKI